jgi:hypothetical protein
MTCKNAFFLAGSVSFQKHLGEMVANNLQAAVNAVDMCLMFRKSFK